MTDPHGHEIPPRDMVEPREKPASLTTFMAAAGGAHIGLGIVVAVIGTPPNWPILLATGIALVLPGVIRDLRRHMP